MSRFIPRSPAFSLFLRRPAAAPSLGAAITTACLAPLLLGGPLLLSGCVVSVDHRDGPMVREEKRFKVSGGPHEISLITFDGAIDVRGWDKDEVFVEIEKRGKDQEAIGQIEIATDQTGQQVRLEARLANDKSSRWGMPDRWAPSAKLIASVPMGSSLLLRTGDGGVTVERVKGHLDLRTSDGDLNGIDLTGEIVARTGDGRVNFEGIDGKADIVTGDGGINLTGRFDLLRARTSDGSLTLKVLPGSNIGEDWSLQTGDGNVVFYLPDMLNAAIEAETTDGSAKADPALEMRLEADMPKRMLRGTLGTGGKLVRVSTGDGSIVFKRLPAARLTPKGASPEQPVERERPASERP